MKIIRFSRRQAIAAGLGWLAGAAMAQTAPATVRLLVGYVPGGPVDTAARLFAPALAQELGVPVQVENRAGANATLAGDMVAKGAPDGSLLWFAASPTLTISPHVMKKMAFDPARDLTALAPVLAYYNVLVVNKELPFHDLKSLIEHAKANPGTLAYGSAGVGASNHLSGELFSVRTGTRLLHIPYKGNAPAMTDLIGGRIAMLFDIVGGARPFIAGQRVRALAVTSPRRNPSLPEVPTMAEAGVPGFDVGGWYAVYGPANMPAALVTRYHRSITAALAQPELRARLEEMGYELWTATPQQVDERARRERAMWATVTKGVEIE